MTDEITNPDPEVIERDIRRTQEDMSRTVDKIGDQLTIKNVVNALLDKADQNDVDARMLLDGARRNPIALGLIAAGAIWLVSDKDSKFPSASAFKPGKGKDHDYSDFDHRDYVSHMSSVEWRDDEDQAAYQRRRDIARANYLMVERRHDEDDHGFRQRLDAMTDAFREKRRAWADSSSQAGQAARQKGRAAAGRVQDLYDGNPLVGGIIAAAVGATLGSSLPITRKEQDTLGGVGEKARDLASEHKDQIAAKIGDKKDELLEKADQKLQGAQSTSQPVGGSTEMTSSDARDSAQSTPFIIGDRN
jgi:hypothetical protein